VFDFQCLSGQVVQDIIQPALLVMLHYILETIATAIQDLHRSAVFHFFLWCKLEFVVNCYFIYASNGMNYKFFPSIFLY